MWVSPDVVIHNVMEIAGRLMFMVCLPFIAFPRLFALNCFLTPANKFTFKCQRASSPQTLGQKRGRGRGNVSQAGPEHRIHHMSALGYLEKLKVGILAPFYSKGPQRGIGNPDTVFASWRGQ